MNIKKIVKKKILIFIYISTNFFFFDLKAGQEWWRSGKKGIYTDEIKKKKIVYKKEAEKNNVLPCKILTLL